MLEKVFSLRDLYYITASVAVFCLFYSPVQAFDCGDLLAVDVNSASEEELECITHIGPSRARDLISLRPFSSIEDLQRVGGIGGPGSATLTAIEDQGLAVIGGGVILKEKDETDTGDENEELNDEEKTKTSVTEAGPSAHSSPVELSTLDEIETFKISAGRDRLVSVEGEVRFRAYVDSETNIPGNAKFEWVMGDGSVKTGREIEHRYFAPGSYFVVLTVRIAGEEAVSRVNIEVIEPEVFIKRADGGSIVLFNSAEGEVNLGGWEIRNGEKSFSIPDNTIIGAGSELTLTERATGIQIGEGEKITLYSPMGGFDHVHSGEGLVHGESISREIPEDEEVNDDQNRNELLLEIDFLREEINRLRTNPTYSESVVENEHGISGTGYENVTNDGDTAKEAEVSVSSASAVPQGDTEEGMEEDEDPERGTRIETVYEGGGGEEGLWRKILRIPSGVFERFSF